MLPLWNSSIKTSMRMLSPMESCDCGCSSGEIVSITVSMRDAVACQVSVAELESRPDEHKQARAVQRRQPFSTRLERMSHTATLR